MDVNVSPDKPASPADQSPTGVNKLTFDFCVLKILFFAICPNKILVVHIAGSRKQSCQETLFCSEGGKGAKKRCNCYQADLVIIGSKGH